jgi:hypothetical protein
MKNIYQFLLVQAAVGAQAWISSGTIVNSTQSNSTHVHSAPHNGFSKPLTTTECLTPIAPSPSPCPEVDVTVIVTETIVHSGPAITITETSVSKSGVVLNTTGSASSSALKPRNFPNYDSIWKVPTASGYLTESETFTYPAYCSPLTLTKTATQFTTVVGETSTVTEIAVKTEPGVLLPSNRK